MNRAMQELMVRGADLAEVYVPSPFQLLVAGGFKNVQGCVFFRELFHHDALTALAMHHDMTGYECAVNAIHLEDYLEKGMAREAPALAATAARCADWLMERLRRFSSEPFRVIVSVQGRNCTLRFHKLRDGESWLADDLEGYAESVATYDTV
jgi:hypothetical protein